MMVIEVLLKLAVGAVFFALLWPFVILSKVGKPCGPRYPGKVWRVLR